MPDEELLEPVEEPSAPPAALLTLPSIAVRNVLSFDSNSLNGRTVVGALIV